MTLHSERYPFDFDAYGRGDIVPIKVFQDAYPKLDADELRFRMRSVKDDFDDFLYRTTGETHVVCVRKEGLVILTIDEQHVYIDEQHLASERKTARYHAKDLGMNDSSLTEDQKQHRRKRILKTSWLMQQQAVAKRMKLPQLEDLARKQLPKPKDDPAIEAG